MKGALMNPILRIISFVIENLMHIWPVLLVTIPISVLIKHFNADKKIKKIFSKHWLVAILIATAIGAFAPFCSCSIIPVIAALIASGVPIAPVMAFWLASPSMDPEIFLFSTATLGFNLALARLIATGFMSFFGGVITHYVIDKKRIKPVGFMTQQAEVKRSRKELIQLVLKECLSTLWLIVRFLILAYTLEALIIFYLPESIIQNLFGTGPLSVVKATFIGIPLYTTNLSALGIVSGLITKGLSQGAALSFLIAGATTTIPAMAAVYKIVERKIFFLYLSLATGFAFVSGMLFDLIFV
jgi:uncharacterized membrane protein YraQ (UPF0718 family)